MAGRTVNSAPSIDLSDPRALYAAYKAAQAAVKAQDAQRVAALSEEGAEFLTSLVDIVPIHPSTTGKGWVGGDLRGLTARDSEGNEFTVNVTFTDVSRTKERNEVLEAGKAAKGSDLTKEESIAMLATFEAQRVAEELADES